VYSCNHRSISNELRNIWTEHYTTAAISLAGHCKVLVAAPL
jgi:hypothetical protein